MIYKRVAITLLFSLLVVSHIAAQEVEISLGRNAIAFNEFFEIKLVVNNDKLKSYSDFPSIPGFSDMGNSTSTNISIINGRQSSSYTLTKRYRPSKKGKFKLPAFTMTVNGQKVTSPGTTITVGEAKQQNRRNNFFSSPFFDDPYTRRQPQFDFQKVDDDAFFLVSANKKEIYQGEGVLITMTMYIPYDQRQLLNFKDDIGDQIAELKEKVIPKYCIEENFPITQIETKQTEIKGKPYLKFDLYQSMIYPVNADDITIPSVPLEMIKYQVSKQRDFFGRRQTKEDYKNFYSGRSLVKVNPLPDHPLKNEVSVGQFQLKEELNTEEVEVGGSFNYTFSIVGRGNIGNISAPNVENDEGLEFFHPEITQNIERGMGTVSGYKRFNYNVLVNEPGDYALNDYYQWIYFDPVKEVYDTLKATKAVHATGESFKNAAIESNDLDGIYARINTASNELIGEREGNNFVIFANILVLGMASTMIVLFIRRRKKKHG